jgi:1,4-alpha-glucan branching enzyme
MGAEIGQTSEWNHDASLHWDLIDDPMHGGLQRLVRDLNQLYVRHPALQFGDIHPQGFEWSVVDDAEHSVIAMFRWDRDRQSAVLVASNFTPVPRSGYRIGVPSEGSWEIILNSDAAVYGGANTRVADVTAEHIDAYGHPFSIAVDLPPLSTVMFRLNQGQ